MNQGSNVSDAHGTHNTQYNTTTNPTNPTNPTDTLDVPCMPNKRHKAHPSPIIIPINKTPYLHPSAKASPQSCIAPVACSSVACPSVTRSSVVRPSVTGPTLYIADIPGYQCSRSTQKPKPAPTPAPAPTRSYQANSVPIAVSMKDVPRMPRDPRAKPEILKNILENLRRACVLDNLEEVKYCVGLAVKLRLQLKKSVPSNVVKSSRVSRVESELYMYVFPEACMLNAVQVAGQCIQHCARDTIRDGLEKAAMHGHLDIIKLAYEHSFRDFATVYEVAIRTDRLNIIGYLTMPSLIANIDYKQAVVTACELNKLVMIHTIVGALAWCMQCKDVNISELFVDIDLRDSCRSTGQHNEVVRIIRDAGFSLLSQKQTNTHDGTSLPVTPNTYGETIANNLALYAIN